MQKFKSSHLEKMKLKEVAEEFRGKSILKKDTTLGSISVLNISNIENGDINFLTWIPSKKNAKSNDMSFWAAMLCFPAGAQQLNQPYSNSKIKRSLLRPM
jgi:hypothetical protein